MNLPPIKGKRNRHCIPSKQPKRTKPHWQLPMSCGVTNDRMAREKVPNKTANMEERQDKLVWINRLLNPNENKACLEATNDEKSGIYVIARHELQEGTMVLSYESEGFVLETPELRRNYCSYCGCKKDRAPIMFCLNCLDSDGNPMVGYCSNCIQSHKQHHIENPVECRVFQCLRATITDNETSSDKNDNEAISVTNQCLREIFQSSVALLAIKLLARKTQASQEKRSWWDKIQLLYETPLPSPYSPIAMLLGAALDAVVDNPTCTHESLARSTLGRILGCSHAVVDPSLPLGKQTLGRAIYVGHSFYNHSCSPNAYLSTRLPSKYNDDTVAQGLNARVHLLRPVSEGEEITLSYLPLSGLSRQERQETLQASYGFSCSCNVCCDDHHPLVLPPTADRAGIDSLREIQYGLNDKLTDLSKKMIKDLRYSIIRQKVERCIRKQSFRHHQEDDEDEKEMENKPNSQFVVELDRILRTIEMTEKGISNQNLPECHELSIESDRLSAAACDLWLKVMGESMCVSSESSSDSHLEFIRKTAQIRDMFDPVALGTQCLASSAACILRSHEKKKKKEESTEEDWKEEIKLSKIERERGLKLLATCLGSDHSWVKKLESDTISCVKLGLSKRKETDKTSNSAKRQCI